MRHSFVLFYFTLLAAGTLHAAPLTLTLAAAQQQALDYSRQLDSHVAAADAARSLAIAAGQLPDPVLRIGIDNIPADGMDRGSLGRDFMTMRRVGIQQELTGSDKRSARRDVQLRTADKAEAQRRAATAALRRATAMAWLDRYYAEQKLALVELQATQARQEILAADGAYRGGRGSLADVLAARSAVVLIDDQRDELAQRARAAATMLARWTGTTGNDTLSGPPDIDHLAREPLAPDLSRESEIAVLTAQEQVAAAEARLALTEKKSDWSVEVGYAQRGPAYANMVSVGLSIPFQLDQANRQDRMLAARLASVGQARAERDEALRERQAQTRNLLDAWRTDLARHQRYEMDLIPLAQQRSAAVLAAWRGGKATLPELLLARRNETEVALMAVDHAASAARLWAQLNFLLDDDSGVTR
ncbi:TolC family protein [Actimicrobium sp. CCI2.3]|uniref:TolC family protein n=1 Tax=Actimicrobium sp. CCI2.3 TaxID=3048616 RepID=UPI002AB4A33A|nr:TolC family protein [Actimicrobium sp. CCI2.3]MDY7573637.1 TolC family protein [Actimicrobium sp. CCI2.3]MEB0021092.1 TolC family protein [Actimicrobium sp. CCI2.3]